MHCLTNNVLREGQLSSLFVFLYLAGDFEIIGELFYSPKALNCRKASAAGDDIVLAIVAFSDNQILYQAVCEHAGLHLVYA